MSEQPSVPASPEQKPVVPTVDAVKAQLAEMSKAKIITRDQEKIGAAVLEDEYFALLANRALMQGADPEFLRRTAGEAFSVLASRLGLSIEEAHQAIETAHRSGPGSFAVDSAQEWLWLVMVKHSLDEANKPKDPAQVVAASARMLVAFEAYAHGTGDAVADAKAYRAEMLAKIQPVGTAPQGADIPLYENDLGFYAAYRNGKHAAAVRTKEGLVFYGTDSSVKLGDLGIKVDKQLSDYFGIVFPQKT